MSISVTSSMCVQEFPALYWHTSILFLRNCPGFYLAKCGNYSAARNIVGRCINQKLAEEIRQNYPNAVLLPVMSNSKLPLALAQAIGLEVCTEPYMHPDGMRKWANNTQRLLHRVELEKAASRRYILVDDIVDRHGAVFALKNHITACGGAVDAVVALACSLGGEAQMPKSCKYQAQTDKPWPVGPSSAYHDSIPPACAG